MAGRKKKKNGLTLGILTLALVFVIGAYVLLLKRNQAAEEEETEGDTSVVLTGYELEQVEELTVEYNGNSLKLTAAEDGFSLAGEEGFPLDETQAEMMIRAAAELSAEALVDEEPEDLEQYGLLEPEVRAVLKLKDGTAITICFGDTIPSESSRYAKLENSNAVYRVGGSTHASLIKTKEELIKEEELPSVSGTIRKVKLERNGKETVCFRYEPDNRLDRSGSNSNPWLIESEAGTVLADSSAMAELLGNYESFSVIDCVDYRKENLEQYGLFNPPQAVRVFYVEDAQEEGTAAEEKEKEITLYIGNQAEDGTYYVRSEDSSFVYRMNVDTAVTLMNPDLEELADKYIVRASIDTVGQLTVTFGKVEHVAEIKRIETKNEDGTVSTGEHFILDGRDFGDDSEFRSYYEKVITLKGNSLLAEDTKLTETPVLSIRLDRNTENLSVLTADFIPYDSSYYAVCLEGTPRFLIDMREAQAFIEETEKAFAR